MSEGCGGHRVHCPGWEGFWVHDITSRWVVDMLVYGGTRGIQVEGNVSTLEGGDS